MVILGNYVLQETRIFCVCFFFSFLASFLYRMWYGTQTNHNVSGSLNCFVVAVAVVVIVVVLVQFQIYII